MLPSSILVFLPKLFEWNNTRPSSSRFTAIITNLHSDYEVLALKGLRTTLKILPDDAFDSNQLGYYKYCLGVCFLTRSIKEQTSSFH